MAFFIYDTEALIAQFKVCLLDCSIENQTIALCSVHWCSLVGRCVTMRSKKNLTPLILWLKVSRKIFYQQVNADHDIMKYLFPDQILIEFII